MVEGAGAHAARLVVADAHPVVRRAVRLSCEALPGLEVVGEADSGSAVLAVCDELRPDVAVLDIALPDGLDAIRGLNDRQLVDIVVVLTDRTDGASVMEALRLGVEGYLVKSSALPSVGRQIRRVLDGERVISPEVQRTALGELGAFARMAREGSEVRASVSVSGGGLRGRVIAKATEALLAGGALQGAAGRIARAAEQRPAIAVAA